MVLRPEKHGEAEAIFRKWGLDFADVGRTTDDLRFRVRRNGAEVANLPIKDLGDQAPEYDRPWAEPKPPCPARHAKPAALRRSRPGAPEADRLARSLLAPLGLGAVRPPGAGQHRAAARRRRRGGAARRQRQGAGALARRDAALRRGRSVRGRQAGGGRVLAQPDRGRRDAARGNRQSEFRQSRTARDHGAARPRASQGIGEACRALDFPIVSGNVSLYNETNGQGILPTPAIGGVGLLDDWRKSATLAFKAEGEMILLVGAPPSWGTHLGQSLYLREIHGPRETARRRRSISRTRSASATSSARMIRRRAGYRGARCLRWRAGGCASRDGDGLRASARQWQGSIDTDPAAALLRGGSGPLSRDCAIHPSDRKLTSFWRSSPKRGDLRSLDRRHGRRRTSCLATTRSGT